MVADALSRPEIFAVAKGNNPVQEDESIIDFSEVAVAQKSDDEVINLTRKSPSVFQLDEVPVPQSKETMICDMTTGSPRPLLPVNFRKVVFNKLHGMAHPGVKASRALISCRYVWPKMHRDIKLWVQQCLQCQRSKVHRHTSVPIGTFQSPDARFDHVHIDIVGPLPYSNGFRYILTCVDRFTRWPEAWPIVDITAQCIAKTFFDNWICRFGVPSTVTTDRGSQFESHLFRELTRTIGCKRIRTTSYHPAANGMVERMHRQLKAALTSQTNPNQWSETLPLVLFGMRTVVKEDIKASSAEMVFGSTLRIPGEFFNDSFSNSLDPTSYVTSLKTKMRQLKITPASHHTSKPVYQPRFLNTCTHCFVRDDRVRPPLSAPYKGPYKVVFRRDKHFTLDINGKSEVISIDRLKPAFYEPNIVSFTNMPEIVSFPPPASGSATSSDVETAGAQSSNAPVTRSGRAVHFPRHFRDFDCTTCSSVECLC